MRAEDSLDAAKSLVKTEHYDVVASRCYYGAFYASSAWLLTEGFEYGKHSGVIAAVHQRFVKPGLIPREFGQKLNWLFELRGVGDYGVAVHVSKADASEALVFAKEYVAAVKKHLPVL
jgi:uncharacterized protein (UPF0332 family)